MTANTSKQKNTSNPDQKNKKSENSIFSNVFFYVVLALIFFAAITGTSYEQMNNANKRPISELYSLIRQSKVDKILIDGDNLKVTLRDGNLITTQKEPNISFDEMLTDNGIDKSLLPGGVEVKSGHAWLPTVIGLAQIVLPILFILFLFRKISGAGNDMFAFGKSKAKLFNKDSPQIKFTDVAGSDEAKGELVEIVDFLKNPGKYRALGARIPKGVLLVGPAGVGKTLLAKAVAGEAQVPFFSVAGSEFMEMLVGVGSARVRDLFNMAKAAHPSLIFIDEIDAIGRQRGMGIGGGHDEREQTLNQILVEMDGFDPRVNVIVLAATNRPDMLDPALVRPGRFDRKVTITLPDLKERREIIGIHMKGKPFVENIDMEKIARRTVGFSGADIENMLNESAILAARKQKKTIDEKDLEEGALKVQLGPERKKMQSDEEKRAVAYHEAGHALVAAYSKDMDPVHRISIISRGMSLGHTLFPPALERYNETKTRLMSMITTSLGGRAAEEVVFNEVTVGASNDIEKATDVARRMVMDFGMSEELGPINYDAKDSRMWVAKDMNAGFSYSQEVAAKIDQEIKKIIDECHDNAKRICAEHRDKLNAVAEALIIKETLEAEDFEALIGRKVATVDKPGIEIAPGVDAEGDVALE